MKGDGQLKYSEITVKKILKAGDLSLEEQINFNILNFIRTIHLNELEFIESSFRSEFFGEPPMTFQKNPGQVMGLKIIMTWDIPCYQ